MKKILNFSLLFIAAILVINACNKESNSSINLKLSDSKISSLIDDYNNNLKNQFGDAIPEIKKGFVQIGELKMITQIDPEKEILYMSALLSEENSKESKYNFDVGLYTEKEFPSFISKAKIVFIGNQLIVIDLNSDYQQNFFVKNGKTVANKTPSLETLDAISLRIKTGPNIGLNLKGPQECDCDCKDCHNFPNCPNTTQCSCACPSGAACSTTCTGNNNAECDQNCGGAEQ